MKILVLGKSLSQILATASYNFYRELAKQADCVFYGEGFSQESGIRIGDTSKTGNDVLKMVELEKPDAIWCQWFFGSQPEGGWKNLSQVTDIPKIAMGGDPWSNLDIKAKFAKTYCDCIILDSGLPDHPVWKGHWKDFKATLFHAGIKTNMFNDLKLDRTYDVGVFGARNPTYYPTRLFIAYTLARQRRIKSWTPEIGLGTLSTEQGYARALNECKIVVCTGEMHVCTGEDIPLLTHKYLESMACNALVLGPLPVDSRELHFEDGYNIVSIDKRNFLMKIEQYVRDVDERLRIAKNGYDTVQKYHTIDRRASRFIELCEKLIAGEPIPPVMS